jgi:hypothetical protein
MCTDGTSFYFAASGSEIRVYDPASKTESVTYLTAESNPAFAGAKSIPVFVGADTNSSFHLSILLHV